MDRVEDNEIRTVAQLVRSIADFRGISYVLAYDSERVMQALGSGANEGQSLDRGRAYLEKIVQFPIPIPIIFDNEIIRLITIELKNLAKELKLPEQFETIARFQRLMQILVENAIHTPRDIRRFVGTYHVLAGMLRGEVDWIDLLAYSALLIKAPATVEKMRRYPDEFLDDPQTERAMRRMLVERKTSTDDRLQELIPQSELNHCTKVLLGFLFPSLAEFRERNNDHTDAFHERRPLLTTLRLGLLPGTYSRDEIHTIFVSKPIEIRLKLQEAYDNGIIDSLTDRIDDLYLEIPSNKYIRFWQGVSDFTKKNDCEWMSAYSQMHEKIRNFTSILEQSIKRDQSHRDTAIRIFTNLRNSGESELIAYWLRNHFFIYGIYGCEKRGGDSWFLDLEQTESIARDLAVTWRTEHLTGKLLPCRWDLQSAFTMVDMNIWDEPCRRALDETLEHDKSLDGFALLLFGGNYSVDRSTISKMCSLEKFIERCKSRLEVRRSPHETVQAALRKAVRG